MGGLHCFQLLLVYSSIETFFPGLRNKMEIDKTVFLLFMATFIGLYAIFVYNKKRWQGYIEEFKSETKAQRKKGTIVLLVYTIGSLVFFFIAGFVLGVYFW